MGTINYRTSDYITMGVYPQSEWDFRNDKDEIIEEMIMNGYDEEDITDAEYSDYVYRLIADYEEDDYYEAKRILEEYTDDLQYFTVEVEAGYYQGFSIMIEYDGYEFSDIDEKRRARAEAERVGECLEALADIGLVACYPSWGTRYEDHARTREVIAEAVDAMKEDVRLTNVDAYAWEV